MILRRVREATHGALAHPGAFEPTRTASDWERFAETLRSVGGEPVGPVSRDELVTTLMNLAERSESGRVLVEPRLYAELGTGAWEAVPDGTSPHTLTDVGMAIVRGSIGVAENGAVAVEGKHAPLQALPFLCEQLVLLLELEAVVPDMHEASARMPADALRFHHFTWISGPSKTADIEQTLVLGAHAARALMVVGIRDS